MSSTALNLLAAAADAHHARLTQRGATEATFVVEVPSPSGRPGPAYLIAISADGAWVSAREVVPARLPAFCAERHINPGGSFCLFWAEEDPLEIVSDEAAAAWWSTLLMFLRRQETAAKLRRWPGEADARAHGPTAARHQATAERLAEKLGPTFAAQHRAGRFRVTRHRRLPQSRLRLTLDGHRFLTVRESPPTVMTLRACCRCDEAQTQQRALRSCADHAAVLAGFVVELHAQAEAETRFYAAIRAAKLSCCGTLDNCPLAA